MILTRQSPQSVIRHKRDGEQLDTAAIEDMVAAVVDGTASEGQIAAFAMAVFFRGMVIDESVALTDSGTVLTWPLDQLRGPVIDKHSTGGVGDTVSLVLAPMLAACNAHVPMISGRGLGHTGGTLDKLESIPGYAIHPDKRRFMDTVVRTGCAIVGQSDELAPADRKFYAVRDVTATVESIPLITASILAKKLAAGLSVLVMDIKVGNGAFASNMTAAETLATSIVRVGQQLNLNTTALLTDMNEPLGNTAGNALEVQSAIDYLTGRYRDKRLHTVVLALGVELLGMTGLASNPSVAHQWLQQVLDNGAAAERFEAMVAALGGPRDLLNAGQRRLPTAPCVRPVLAAHAGVVNTLDTRQLGEIVVQLGGGRLRIDDRDDAAVRDAITAVQLAIVMSETDVSVSGPVYRKVTA
jgi:thymidine phosphorylase